MSSESNNVGLGLQMGGDVEESVDPETSFPVFEVQPSMLAVDIVLAPGESRSCEAHYLPSIRSTLG